MMEFWSGTWSDFGTIIGIVVSVVGLGWAIWEARGARSASIAAQDAARETREQLAHQLQRSDIQRAIGLIGRIKTLHDNSRWEGSTELYQILREMLSDVIVRCPESHSGFREKLSAWRASVGDMEDFVRRSANQEITKRQRHRLNKTLNLIQSDLEELASSVDFGDSQGEAR